jgi:hypothetical protein
MPWHYIKAEFGAATLLVREYVESFPQHILSMRAENKATSLADVLCSGIFIVEKVFAVIIFINALLQKY